MVFPKKVGFGPCYLVSTRHEILSNIDRNAKPNRNSAAAPKKPKWNEYRESANPVLRVSVVFQLFDFQLSMFLEVQSKKVILELPQSRANIQLVWLVVGLIQQEDNWTGTDPHRTGFHRFTEIGLIFHYKIFN